MKPLASLVRAGLLFSAFLLAACGSGETPSTTAASTVGSAAAMPVPAVAPVDASAAIAPVDAALASTDASVEHAPATAPRPMTPKPQKPRPSPRAPARPAKQCPVCAFGCPGGIPSRKVGPDGCPSCTCEDLRPTLEPREN